MECVRFEAGCDSVAYEKNDLCLEIIGGHWFRVAFGFSTMIVSLKHAM